MKPVNFDHITDEELASVDALRGKSSSNKPFISNEWAFVSELGSYYGWDAIAAYLSDIITETQALQLIKGGRRMHAIAVYDSAIAQLAAASTKKGSFEKLMKPYTNAIDGVK